MSRVFLKVRIYGETGGGVCGELAGGAAGGGGTGGGVGDVRAGGDAAVGGPGGRVGDGGVHAVDGVGERGVWVAAGGLGGGGAAELGGCGTVVRRDGSPWVGVGEVGRADAESAEVKDSSGMAVPVISSVGWLVVLVAAASTYRGLSSGTILTIAVVGACSVVLVRRRDFPRRSEGLVSSWVGPLLLIVGELVTKSLFLGGSHPGDAPATAGGIVAGLLITGVFVAAVGAWIMRGYGLIPIMALGASILPGRSSRLEREVREQYPPRWWWLAPAGVLIMCAVLAMIVYDVMFYPPVSGIRP